MSVVNSGQQIFYAASLLVAIANNRDRQTIFALAKMPLISAGRWSRSGFKKQGVPIQAEKIPFEPDLGNASVGNGRYRIFHQCHQGPYPVNGCGPFFIDSAFISVRRGAGGAVVMKKVVFIVSGGELGDPVVFPGTGGEDGARGGDLRRRRRPPSAWPRGSFPPSSSATWIRWIRSVRTDYESMGCRIIRHPQGEE